MSVRNDGIEIEKRGAGEAGGAVRAATDTRATYAPPRLERLGAWSALTLQQSVPIFP